MLSDEQIERYSRQIILPQVGGKGQEKLLQARVLVNGSGPLQTALLHYLAAAGVGTLGVFPPAASPLLTALASPHTPEPFQILTRLNPDCSIVLHADNEGCSPFPLVRNYDLVLADSDALHDACWLTKRPFLYASVSDTEAWLMQFHNDAPDAACLRCYPLPLPSRPPTAPLAQVFSAFIGSHLATEAIKTLLHVSPLSRNTVRRFQISLLQYTAEPLAKSPDCICCRSSLSREQ
jgi:adenylyltransferase/sulfurtransferase